MIDGVNPTIEHETIQEISHERATFSRWSPIIGQETLGLLDHLEKIPEDAKIAIRNEALAILSRCIPPTSPDATETGLVIGYIQSGKTMSFTTVAALARDNGYQMIIVITGISMPLFIQSLTRLHTDLRLDTRRDHKWQPFRNPSPHNRDHIAIQNTLGDWADPTLPALDRQTVLITVMKNHRHLENLRSVLAKLDLHGVPTLIIDDEADQAGLNTRVKRGEQSTTYQRLLGIRGCLPDHTFLQYTATPQAPLLINIIDVLSPNFTELLSPGHEYVGGREFFVDHPELVRIIPSDEIPGKDHRLKGPPESLFNAMKIYFLGVAAGLALEDGNGNRSMLVHPSQQTMRHRQYYHWVMQRKELWKNVLGLDPQSSDRRDLVADFADAYQDLRSTVRDLPSFDILVSRLLRAVRGARVEEVNATRGQTPQVVWNSAYAYVLIGGQAMDRGFTVEGLTVTYMPRGVGVSNADTVQQRARFFGYKQRYLGYCRVFLESAVRDAYHSYVTHEEDIRSSVLPRTN